MTIFSPDKDFYGCLKNPEFYAAFRFEGVIQKKYTVENNPEKLFFYITNLSIHRKHGFWGHIFLVHLFWIFSSDLKSAKKLDFFTPRSNYFEKKNSILRWGFIIFWRENTKSANQRLTNENKQKIVIFLLGFQSLSKNAWTILIFKKRSEVGIANFFFLSPLIANPLIFFWVR